jgi:hypothetical protein
MMIALAFGLAAKLLVWLPHRRGRTTTSGEDPRGERVGSLSKKRGNLMILQDIKAAGAASWSSLFIGQDRSGHWVVKDARSLCGGLFTDRKEAIRFAMYECQRRPQSVIMLPDGLEFDGPLGEDGMSDPAKRRAA